MKENAIGHLVKTNPIQTQFKPNLRNAKMNINSITTKDYRKNDDFAVQKNKSNSNPIKANFHQEMPKMPGAYRFIYIEAPPAARTKWLAMVGTFNYCFEKLKPPVKPVAKDW